MASATLKTHGFTIILAGVSELTPDLADDLFEAGCDDATPWSRGGTVGVDFDRDAESLGDAVGSALKDVERAGLTVARVDLRGAEKTTEPI